MNHQIIPVLKVSDMDSASDFYCSQLGFKQRWAYHSPDQRFHYISVEFQDSELHLSSFPNDGQYGSVIYINVDDVDDLYQRFTRSGQSAVELAPTDQTWQQREMYLRDPDGNGIRFGQAIA